MNTNSTRRLAVLSFSLLATVAAVAVPAAAHADMTDPPACTLDPWGGCQSGPLGNGSGGGGWGPWTPGGALDQYTSGSPTGTGAWAYSRIDGHEVDAWDIETVRTGYNHAFCVGWNSTVTCAD
jgi:hypothetical protein